MKCKFCGKKAEFFLRQRKLYVCKADFFNFLERKVERFIKKYRVKGKILVAISGGKDSLACLSLLSRFLKVSALHLNLGLGEFSKESQRICKEFCKKEGIDLILVNVKEEFKVSPKNFSRKKACSICGVIKRYLTNRIAFENGFKIVATGHTADDLASMIILNFLSGNFDLLFRLKPYTEPSLDLKLVGKIKPLYNVLEEETEFFCKLKGIEFVSVKCKFERYASQTKIKEILNDLTKDLPQIKLQIVSNFLNLAKNVKPEKPKLKFCKICGYPTIRDVCRFCKLIKGYEN